MSRGETGICALVEEFLDERIGTIDQLLVLLQLVNARRFQSIDELTRGAELTPLAVMDALEHLERRALVVAFSLTGARRYAYLPADPALERAVDLLVTTHLESPIRVYRAVSARALARTRAGLPRAFEPARWRETEMPPRER
jgi:hypothetical protein